MSKLRRIRNVILRLIGSIVVLLWIGVAVFWVRSYFVGDGVVLSREWRRIEPRRHSTFVILSGKGGIALGMRTFDTPGILAIQRVEGIRWSIYPSPSYPAAGASALGILAFSRVTLAPTSGPAAAQIATASGSVVVSQSPGGSMQISANGAPPTTMSAGAMVITGSGQPVIVGRAAGTGPGVITVSGGTVTFGNAPTTMGSALASAAIAPPPNPPTGPRQFYAYTTAITPENISRVVIFPYWSLQALLTLPLLWVIISLKAAWVRNRRRKEGCCIRCGYDLRATPERCPECGTAALPEARSSINRE